MPYKWILNNLFIQRETQTNQLYSVHTRKCPDRAVRSDRLNPRSKSSRKASDPAAGVDYNRRAFRLPKSERGPIRVGVLPPGS